MQAKETKLQDIIEGTKQYVIPLFQRTYSWTNKEWDILWKDLVELCESENPRTHFIGSIVNMPTVSVPEGVAKFLLIDGQQRLTTIFIILTLLRNKAREAQNQEFAEERSPRAGIQRGREVGGPKRGAGFPLLRGDSGVCYPAGGFGGVPQLQIHLFQAV